VDHSGAPRQIRCTKESKNGWPRFGKFYRYTFCIWAGDSAYLCDIMFEALFYRYENRAMSEKPSADLGVNWILRRGPRRPLSAATKLTVLLLLMLGNHRGTVVEACCQSTSSRSHSAASPKLVLQSVWCLFQQWQLPLTIWWHQSTHFLNHQNSLYKATRLRLFVRAVRKK
jgi:hypothetical protein